ncbi:MAG: trehalase family glycosidase [Bacteroidales bacterium]
MKRYLPYILLLTVLVLAYVLLAPDGIRKHKSTTPPDLENFADVLNLQQWPQTPHDRSAYCFADKGAWHGYGVVPDSLKRLGFTGPFIMGIQNGYWLSPQLISFHLSNEIQSIEPLRTESHSFPGYVKQVAFWEDLGYVATLHFVDSLTAMVRVEWTNTDTAVKQVEIHTRVSVFPGKEQKVMLDSQDVIVSGIGDVKLRVRGMNGQKWEVADSTATIQNPIVIRPDEVFQQVFTLSMGRDSHTGQWDALSAQGSFADTYELWQQMVLAVWPDDPADMLENQKRLAVKSLQTLITNWRHAKGDLPYGGLFPSYNYKWFNGFWAWDSWKHSVALASVHPVLAKDQIRTLAVWQDSCGMIPDVIYTDSAENNWRNTKPPLMSWAVWKIFTHTHDTTFVQEMLPKLERYHAWWYAYRDADEDGLCEYGCTDGTLIAAKWESGMDNAVRFDTSRLIKNDGHSWSLNQESVDLNAYLAAEKGYLSKLASATGQIAKADRYANGQEKLKQQILANFWHETDGYFYDKSIDGEHFIQVRGPEAWIPLWAGVATPEQAQRVAKTLADTTHFATYVPFPTVDYSHPGFDPSRGYWRGPVWVDQVYFAIQGLRNYGYSQQADELQQAFLNHAEGMFTNAPLRENYHPLTGAGLNAKHFSWTAAHILMMLHEQSPGKKKN